MLRIANDKVGLGRITGHRDGVAFGCYIGRGFVDVVGCAHALVAQIQTPAHLVGPILKGGVRRQIGHKEHTAGAHGQR